MWKHCDKAREMQKGGRKAVTNFDGTRIKEIINHTSCKSSKHFFTTVFSDKKM